MSKKTQVNSTEQYLPFVGIFDNLVVTKTGQLRAILEVSSVNFGLKSEKEQNAIIFQYQAFLNSLSFPIQIIMRSKKLDLTTYLKDLEEHLAKETNELIRFQTAEYISFISKLITVANIMEKKFFIVIPYIPPPSQQGAKGLFGLFKSKKVKEIQFGSDQFKRMNAELMERTQVIAGGLSGMGLKTRLLTTEEVIEVFYEAFNPETQAGDNLIDSTEIAQGTVQGESERPKEQAQNPSQTIR